MNFSRRTDEERITSHSKILTLISTSYTRRQNRRLAVGLSYCEHLPPTLQAFDTRPLSSTRELFDSLGSYYMYEDQIVRSSDRFQLVQCGFCGAFAARTHRDSGVGVRRGVCMQPRQSMLMLTLRRKLSKTYREQGSTTLVPHGFHVTCRTHNFTSVYVVSS